MQNVENRNTPGDMMMAMMDQCMKMPRWLPLLPVTIGVTLFLFGFFLEAEVVRALFLILAVIPVIMGVFGFFMMNFMKK